jgi:hypothetical protein
MVKFRKILSKSTVSTPTKTQEKVTVEADNSPTNQESNQVVPEVLVALNHLNAGINQSNE